MVEIEIEIANLLDPKKVIKKENNEFATKATYIILVLLATSPEREISPLHKYPIPISHKTQKTPFEALYTIKICEKLKRKKK